MSLYGVIGYHVTLSKETLLVATLIYLSQNYSNYIRGDRSSLKTPDRWLLSEIDNALPRKLIYSRGVV